MSNSERAGDDALSNAIDIASSARDVRRQVRAAKKRIQDLEQLMAHAKMERDTLTLLADKLSVNAFDVATTAMKSLRINNFQDAFTKNGESNAQKISLNQFLDVMDTGQSKKGDIYEEGMRSPYISLSRSYEGLNATSYEEKYPVAGVTRSKENMNATFENAESMRPLWEDRYVTDEGSSPRGSATEFLTWQEKKAMKQLKLKLHKGSGVSSYPLFTLFQRLFLFLEAMHLSSTAMYSLFYHSAFFVLRPCIHSQVFFPR